MGEEATIGPESKVIMSLMKWIAVAIAILGFGITISRFTTKIEIMVLSNKENIEQNTDSIDKINVVQSENQAQFAKVFERLEWIVYLLEAEQEDNK